MMLIAAPPAMSDSAVVAMAKSVQRELLELPEYGPFDHVGYSIHANEVTLRGFASRQALKDAANRVVRGVAGVKNVIDELELLPSSASDDTIRAGVFAAIYGDALLAHYNPNRGVPVWMTPASSAKGVTSDPPPGFHPIRIIVNNGRVRLTGVVDNEADKCLAGIRAQSVPGMLSFDNDLAIVTDAKAHRRK